MQQESNSIYNIISVVFLVLSLLICLVTVGWVSGAVPVPGGLSPATDVPTPTQRVFPTFTPSPTNTPTLQPTWTPIGATEEASEALITPTPGS